MRANEFINEDNLGVNPKRPQRAGTRPDRKETAKPLYKSKDEPKDDLNVDEDWALDERGKASHALCTSSKPDEKLGASMLASCKSQGLRARDGQKSHLIGKKRVVVGGKKIKGKRYGGKIPDYGTRKGQS